MIMHLFLTTDNQNIYGQLQRITSLSWFAFITPGIYNINIFQGISYQFLIANLLL